MTKDASVHLLLLDWTMQDAGANPAKLLSEIRKVGITICALDGLPGRRCRCLCF
jgi:hypothetical protein